MKRLASSHCSSVGGSVAERAAAAAGTGRTARRRACRHGGGRGEASGGESGPDGRGDAMRPADGVRRCASPSRPACAAGRPAASPAWLRVRRAGGAVVVARLVGRGEGRRRRSSEDRREQEPPGGARAKSSVGSASGSAGSVKNGHGSNSPASESRDSSRSTSSSGSHDANDVSPGPRSANGLEPSCRSPSRTYCSAGRIISGGPCGWLPHQTRNATSTDAAAAAGYAHHGYRRPRPLDRAPAAPPGPRASAPRRSPPAAPRRTARSGAAWRRRASPGRPPALLRLDEAAELGRAGRGRRRASARRRRGRPRATRPPRTSPARLRCSRVVGEGFACLVSARVPARVRRASDRRLVRVPRGPRHPRRRPGGHCSISCRSFIVALWTRPSRGVQRAPEGGGDVDELHLRIEAQQQDLPLGLGQLVDRPAAASVPARPPRRWPAGGVARRRSAAGRPWRRVRGAGAPVVVGLVRRDAEQPGLEPRRRRRRWGRSGRGAPAR